MLFRSKPKIWSWTEARQYPEELLRNPAIGIVSTDWNYLIYWFSPLSTTEVLKLPQIWMVSSIQFLKTQFLKFISALDQKISRHQRTSCDVGDFIEKVVNNTKIAHLTPFSWEKSLNSATSPETK